MTTQLLTEPPPPELATALESFEAQFRYPLGPGQQFRISHGRDYLPFFQAMGRAGVRIATDGSGVQGTLAHVHRTLELRRDAGETAHQAAVYLCDLKVDPRARGGRVLATLLRDTLQQLRGEGVQAAYCVVMQGTGRLPTDYTGRLAVPTFTAIGEIEILRLTAPPCFRIPPELLPATREEIDSVRARVPRSGYRASGGQASGRSRMVPVPLTEPGGDAVGWVEDTRRGKQLFLATGEELRSAHLSGFAFATPMAGALLLRKALAIALAHELPALFVSVPAACGPELRSFLTDLEVGISRATVFGHGLATGHDWWIDTAEI
jgi:hypothetical protein